MKLQSLLLPLAIGGSVMLPSLPVTQLALASSQTPDIQPTEIIDFGSLTQGDARAKPIVFTVPVGNNNFNSGSADLRPFRVITSSGGNSGVVGQNRQVTMFAELTQSVTRVSRPGEHQQLLIVKSGDTVIKKALLKVKIIELLQVAPRSPEDELHLKCQQAINSATAECHEHRKNAHGGQGQFVPSFP
jgi:hypothetical protein